MGSYLSRSSGEVQELEISANAAYRYPPKTGNYFSSHFIMGGNKFETMQPEAYLFGENSDLNFLGPKPSNVPYKVSSPSQPVKALRCFVNIRKDSLRIVKVPNSLNKNRKNEERPVDQDRQITTEESEGPFLYNIEFTFDADCPCSITIYYNATEEMFNKNVIYSPEPARDCSDTLHFNPGCNQQFCLPAHKIDPAKLATTTVDWTKGFTRIPIVIQVCADCGPTITGHSHITYAEFYKPSDNTWSIRAIKQKQAIDGVCYLIQEIFGIENKSAGPSTDDADDDDNDLDDDGSDCVVCLSETRDTLILPCKHLCLCSTCANQLRYQQSGCPICRQSFRALLQIRAVRKKTAESDNITQTVNTNRDAQSNDDDENEEDEVEVIVPVPPGYEVVPLIDAIKGNTTTTSRVSDPAASSASTTNVTLVDETATAASNSPSTSSRNVTEEAADDLDTDSIEGETSAVKETSESTTEHTTEVDKEILYEEIPNDSDTEEKVYENIPDDFSADDTSTADLQENAEVPGAEESPCDSAESQNSTKELLPESEKEAGDIEMQEIKVGDNGTITI